MPAMRWRLVGLAVCALAVAAVAAALVQAANRPTVTSTRWRYSVAVPDGWRGVERDDGSILLSTGDATITFVTWLRGPGDPDRARVDEALAAQRRGGREPRLDGRMTVLGQEEPLMVVRFADGARVFELRQLAFDRGNRQWIVSLTAAVDALDRHAATFRAVLDSITLA
jgi:hypothetical protein